MRVVGLAVIAVLLFLIALADIEALLGAIPIALLTIGRIWFSPRYYRRNDE